MNRELSFGSNRGVKVGRGQLWSIQSPSWTQLHFLTATVCSRPKFFQKFRSRARNTYHIIEDYTVLYLSLSPQSESCLYPPCHLTLCNERAQPVTGSFNSHACSQWPSSQGTFCSSILGSELWKNSGQARLCTTYISIWLGPWGHFFIKKAPVLKVNKNPEESLNTHWSMPLERMAE